MSEYRCYCWDTAGRVLSPEDLREVDSLSSHIAVGPTGAWVEYHWGDFKHDPIDVLARYFDVFSYEANWGTQVIAFRFDQGSVGPEELQAYAVEDVIDVFERDGHVLVEARFEENWIEPSFEFHPEHRGCLVRFYGEILAGDYRCLFLLWLRACEFVRDECDETQSVPVPDGIGQLDAAHAELMDFIGVDSDLLDAAKASSSVLQSRDPGSGSASEPLLGQLSGERQRYFLERLLSGNPASVKAELMRELAAVGTRAEKQTDSERTISAFADLVRMADRAKKDRAREEREKEEQARRDYLEGLAANEERLWNAASQLVAAKKTKGYDIAVLLLKGLEDLAAHRDAENEFRRRVAELADAFTRLTGFRRRMAIAGFLDDELKLYRQSQKERWRKKHEGPIDLALLDQLDELLAPRG